MAGYRMKPAVPDEDIYDFVVVGAGGAGMAAALFAAIDHKKVLLVEHSDRVGGTTALSAGTAWIPNTNHAVAMGADDSPGKAAHYLQLAVGNRSSEDLRRAFLENGPKAVAELELRSEVKFRPFPLHPDYLSELEGSVMSGRAIEPIPFDGRKLAARFALLRDPIPEFTILGGMMVDRKDASHLLHATRSFASAWSSLKLLGRHLIDRATHRRGTRLVMGNALCGRLLYSLDRWKVPIWLNAKVEELVRDGPNVTGVVVRHAGSRRFITAKRGVILATGGFSRHPTLRGKLLNTPVPTESPTAPGTTGEMHDLALAAGAQHGRGNLDSAVWAPVSIRRRPDGSTAVYPHFFLDRGKPGMVAVNRNGRRFVSEATSYHLFGRAMFALKDGIPSIPAFLITDHVGIQKYGLGIVKPGNRGLKRCLSDGYVVEAPSLRQLAQKLSIDEQNLEKTIEAMNLSAKTGVDLEFNRGGTVYERTTNGDPAHQPNPCLGAIATAPFYAVRLYPGDIGAATGLVTNSDAQVMGADGQPIGGLYACGNDMNSVMGGTYPGPGINLGPALTFAYIAIHHAS
jgi:succinate dehydrogenase/fumarate reductase flavoprotein subunit